MPWSPPTKPDASIATPDEIVQEAVEYNGAAYRVQPSGRVMAQDSQIPYWAGFTKTLQQYDSAEQADVGLQGIAPPAEGPVGSRRPRATGSKDVADQPPHPVSKHNVLNRATHQETTGEEPAPIFTRDQAWSRS
jgi:hypothetical protein